MWNREVTLALCTWTINFSLLKERIIININKLLNRWGHNQLPVRNIFPSKVTYSLTATQMSVKEGNYIVIDLGETYYNNCIVLLKADL